MSFARPGDVPDWFWSGSGSVLPQIFHGFPEDLGDPSPGINAGLAGQPTSGTDNFSADSFGGMDLSSLFGGSINGSNGQGNNDLFNLLLGLGLSQKGQGTDNLNTLFSGIEV